MNVTRPGTRSFDAFVSDLHRLGLFDTFNAFCKESRVDTLSWIYIDERSRRVTACRRIIIRYCRDEKKMSLKEIAHLFNRTPKAVSRMYMGTR